jgi:hypothetical protein
MWNLENDRHESRRDIIREEEGKRGDEGENGVNAIKVHYMHCENAIMKLIILYN